jgi:GLPGLI family protein
MINTMKNANVLICFLGFLLIPPTVNAQKSFTPDPQTTKFIDNSLMECLYTYTVKGHADQDTTGTPVVMTFKTLLQANATVSKFWDWHSFKLDSILFTSAKLLKQDSIKKLTNSYYNYVKELYTDFVLKNYPNGKLTVTEDLAFNNYQYERPKDEWVWNLMDDTMTVCGYVCNKAVSTYGGRQWTAWYAPEIAISDGPWQLYGLPGLILKAVDSTGEHCFEAISIRNAVHPIYLTNDFQRLKIGKDKFVKQRAQIAKNPQMFDKLNPTRRSLSYSNGCLFVNGRRSSSYLNFVYKPLELR